MDIKEVAKTAVNFFSDLVDQASEIRFEEGIYHADDNTWQVVLSFIQVDNDPSSPTAGQNIKEFKVITINDSNEEVLSVKKRLIIRE